MENYKSDALSLVNVYVIEGQSAAESLYNKIVQSKKLKLWEAKALSNEFSNQIKRLKNES